MRAVLCEAWGGPEDLVVKEIDPPSPGPGEVAIDVAAAGVNFADGLIIAGDYQEKPAHPFSPGFEVAGRVAAVGEGVEELPPGTRVMALLDYGGYAERAVARAEDVFAIPDSMDFATAAGFPITYGTAHGALVWRAGLKAGERLVVHGAAGGVGLATVEAGKALGAHVIASAGGPEKTALAQEHGADAVIDYRSEDLRQRMKELTDGKGADVVFDPVGGSAFEASLRATAWEGRLVVIGFAGGEVPQAPANLLLVKNMAVIGFYWGSYRKKAPERVRAQYEDLFGWFAEGRLRPYVSERMALEEAGSAIALLRARKARGKVVLTTGQD